MIIDDFRGEYAFLSNFYLSKIKLGLLTFNNAEAAFQSHKTLEPLEKIRFMYLNPSDAKRLGRKVSLRADWDGVKDSVMLHVVSEKFRQNEYLADRLIQTGEALLIEGNSWGDRYWGVCRGLGQNKLGNILMQVRSDLNYSKS